MLEEICIDTTYMIQYTWPMCSMTTLPQGTTTRCPLWTLRVRVNDPIQCGSSRTVQSPPTPLDDGKICRKKQGNHLFWWRFSQHFTISVEAKSFPRWLASGCARHFVGGLFTYVKLAPAFPFIVHVHLLYVISKLGWIPCWIAWYNLYRCNHGRMLLHGYQLGCPMTRGDHGGNWVLAVCLWASIAIWKWIKMKDHTKQLVCIFLLMFGILHQFSWTQKNMTHLKQCSTWRLMPGSYPMLGCHGSHGMFVAD